jgi:hypothetical protein
VPTPTAAASITTAPAAFTPARGSITVTSSPIR